MADSLIQLLFCISVLVSINHVSNGQMTIEPSVAIQGTGKSQCVNMTCSLTPEQRTTPMQNLLVISISRNTTRDTYINFLASMIMSGSVQLGQSQDVVDRNPAATGILQIGDGTIHNPRRAELQLTWANDSIECLDAGSYECAITYLDTSLNTQTLVSTKSFSVETIPSDIQLRAYRNGSSVDTDDGTISGVSIGDVVEMRCSGNIGSDPNTLIDWYHTDQLGSTDWFRFVPIAEDDLQQGTATTVTTCQYRRESKLLYHVTADRTNNIAFKCAVTYNQHIADGDRIIYINYVTAIPSDIQLRPYRNGSPVDTNDDTISGVSVGDVVEMRCSGNIGCDPNTLIDWYHTDPLGSTDSFQGFVPSAEDDLQQGAATIVTTCQYHRESRLLYNVTALDAERTNNLAFKCAVTYNQHTAEGDKIIYVTLSSHHVNGAAIKGSHLYMYSVWVMQIATVYAGASDWTSFKY